ncbi:uncharacterized protein AtWU_07138 [Aspergillus tubingensis]|uniref:uncharacterized protein n=1 Tax=Aspergillus tubingensis TaxID=5068 RepID=UPI001577913C|nr:uncharacterized protein AtWU_07138 [Aspergillus tubingensis]GFN17336.1 hypothetical protein AtWU_07138 [Aspergillus tubingensis]
MAPEVLPSYGGLIPLSDTSAINVDARPLLLAVPVWWLEALLYKIRAAVNCVGIGEDGMEFDRVIDFVLLDRHCCSYSASQADLSAILPGHVAVLECMEDQEAQVARGHRLYRDRAFVSAPPAADE